MILNLSEWYEAWIFETNTGQHYSWVYIWIFKPIFQFAALIFILWAYCVLGIIPTLGCLFIYLPLWSCCWQMLGYLPLADFIQWLHWWSLVSARLPKNQRVIWSQSGNLSPSMLVLEVGKNALLKISFKKNVKTRSTWLATRCCFFHSKTFPEFCPNPVNSSIRIPGPRTADILIHCRHLGSLQPRYSVPMGMWFKNHHTNHHTKHYTRRRRLLRGLT